MLNFSWVDPFIQNSILRASFVWHGFFRSRRASPVDWVVGPIEIAGLVQEITEVLPSAESVLLEPHPFYDRARYDWVAPRARTSFGRLGLGPWKLGEIARRARGVVYISGTGYLNTLRDGGATEYAFLRSRGLRIVCYFTGNDIRSPKLDAEREAATGEPNLSTYLSETSPRAATAVYENQKRLIAESADRFADLVFNADVNQRGYLTRPSEPFMYFYPDEDISDDYGKFADVRRPRVIHAPSSPVIKGTQLVRAAVRELQEDGYDFDYIELIRQPHEEVQANLRQAHIVLNQFYSEVPGVFGVEALASGCVVMMRADENDEPILPPGSNDAWVVTRHHQVSRHLRQLLQHPEAWEAQARLGVEWVKKHASRSVSGAALREQLDALLGSDVRPSAE